MTIETLLDLEAVSLKELVGPLKATGERFYCGKGSGSGRPGNGNVGKEMDGKLYFTEEQVIAHLASCLNLNADGSATQSKAPGGTSKLRMTSGGTKWYMWVVLLTNKSDAKDAFKKLHAGIENEAG